MATTLLGFEALSLLCLEMHDYWVRTHSGSTTAVDEMATLVAHLIVFGVNVGGHLDEVQRFFLVAFGGVCQQIRFEAGCLAKLILESEILFLGDTPWYCVACNGY